MEHRIRWEELFEMMIREDQVGDEIREMEKERER